MTFLLGDRNSYEIGVKLRARGLINLPDSTSQKFLLLGQVSKTDSRYGNDRAVIVFLDFSKTRGRKCQDSDYEKWYARPHDSECLMGHRVCVFFDTLPCLHCWKKRIYAYLSIRITAMVQTPKTRS